MKTLKIVVVITFFAAFLFSASSCAVMMKHDNGNHLGWYKNSHNPHHPGNSNHEKIVLKRNK